MVGGQEADEDWWKRGKPIGKGRKLLYGNKNGKVEGMQLEPLSLGGTYRMFYVAIIHAY